VHELGHQWFQSVVATNEAEAPWLDEGFTEYSTVRAFNALYDGALFDCGGWDLTYLAYQRWQYLTMPETPMAGRAWDFDVSYGVATYAKPAVALTTLERLVGEEAMVGFLESYYDAYGFGHPTGEDLRALMAASLGEEVAGWFFDTIVHSSSTLDADVVDLAGLALDREGDLCVPVEVRLVDAGGETSPVWPCEAGPAPEVEADAGLPVGAEDVAVVEIDPDRVAVLDLNLANNGERREVERAAWLGFAVRAVRTLQMLFSLGGP
jgi:hypothetical protein